MSEERPGEEPTVSDVDTTPPNPAPSQPSGGWQMPEPKFQQSSGYLPQGYLEQLGIGEAEKQEAAAAAAAPSSAPAAMPTASADQVEAQPYLEENFEEPPGPVNTAPAAKERSKGARIALILLGILAMGAFVAIFLIVIYFLFIAEKGSSGQF